jgi:hypothetical protein
MGLTGAYKIYREKLFPMKFLLECYKNYFLIYFLRGDKNEKSFDFFGGFRNFLGCEWSLCPASTRFGGNKD